MPVTARILMITILVRTSICCLVVLAAAPPALAIDPPLGRRCDLTLRLTSTNPLGALQVRLEFEGLGQFRGSGGAVQCTSLDDGLLFAANHRVEEQELITGLVGFRGPFAGPHDLWRCVFDIQQEDGLTPTSEDFTYVIEDSTDYEGNPVPASVSLARIDCDGGPLCGDGLLQVYEGCDDGNTATGDGCDEDCEVENCWSCEEVAPTTTTLGDALPGPSTCTPLADETPCSDDDACTAADVCTAGVCTSGGAIDCEDNDVCDGPNFCHALRGCQDGTPLVCNDNSSCTEDTCVPATGCEFTPNDEVCCDIRLRLESPGDFQTSEFRVGYAGANGELEGNEYAVACTNLVPDTTSIAYDAEPGSLLSVGWTALDSFPGPVDLAECGFHSTNGLRPAPEDFDVFFVAATNAAGASTYADFVIGDITCVNDPCGDGNLEIGEACDDANTASGDGCSSSCRVEPCWECQSPSVSTTTLPDGTTPGPSSCTPAADGSPCTDRDDCTDADQCEAGTCGGTAVVCPDDGDICNGAQACFRSGGCQQVSPALDCNDLDDCTDDSCDPVTGCSSVANGDVCCDITFRLDTASTLLTAVQFEVLYSGASGGFEGSYGSVDCTSLAPETLRAFNDYEPSETLYAGFITPWPVAMLAPKNLAECDWHSDDGLPPRVSQFEVTTTDLADTDGNPATGSVSISDIDCPDYSGCPAEPDSECMQAGSSSLVVRDSASDGKDALKWKWKNGGAFGITHISDPTDEGSYWLCLYPDSEPTRADVEIPAGGLWRAISDLAYRFKDPSSRSGVQALKIRPGYEGSTSIGVSAKGSALPDALLPAGQGYTIQLRDVTEGNCWSSSFTNGVLKDETYKAKTP